MDVAEGLAAFFDYAAGDLARRRTPDPAGISNPIKTLIDRETVADRLKKAAESCGKALHCESEEDARDAIADVYWVYVDPSPSSTSKAAYARALRSGNAGVRVVPGGLSLGGATGVSLKTTRSYGG